MTLRYLSDVVMVGVVVLATVLALWGATKDPLIGIGFGVLLVQFYHLMEMRNTTRALIRLYNLLGGRDEPVSEDFRRWCSGSGRLWRSWGVKRQPGELVSSIQALEGAEVVALQTIQAEVPRQVGQYLLLRIRKGSVEQRVMLVAAEVRFVCLDDRAMLDDLLDGTGFFTLEEIRLRRKGKPLLGGNGNGTLKHVEVEQGRIAGDG